MAFKVNYHDFRGKKVSRLNISPERFKTCMFQTKDERHQDAEKYAKNSFFQEKYTREEECEN